MKTTTPLRGASSGLLALGIALATLVAAPAPPAHAADGLPVVQVRDYHLSGPYTHDNLSIFLLHGADRLKGKTILTLQEALEQGKVIVHETGHVNELVIENVSTDVEVFVQSGDIVKGGQQDRLIACDLMVPPKSGQMPVASFCVEAHRWTQRGKEAVRKFSCSTCQLPSRGLRLAGGNLGQFGNQGGQLGMQGGQFGNWGGRYTWARGQFGNLGGGLGFQGAQFGNLGGHFGFQGTQLGNLGGNFGLQGGVFGQFGFGGQWGLQGVPFGQFGNFGGQLGQLGGQLGIQGGVWTEVSTLQRKLNRNLAGDVTSKASHSSLQLTLENERVRQATTQYTNALAGIVDGHEDVIGYAFAINGQVHGADLYASPALFRKLWPKLLHANAVEAVAELRKGKNFATVTAADVVSCLDDTDYAKAFENDVTKRIHLLLRETDQTLFTETRDREAKELWLHRNYVAKERPEVVSFRYLLAADR
jgi:hypothetical protein